MFNDAVVAQVFDDLRFDNTLGASTIVMSNRVGADPVSQERALGGLWAETESRSGLGRIVRADLRIAEIFSEAGGLFTF